MTITIVTGEFSGRREERIARLGWGRCYIERPVRPYPDEPWIYDNAAFRETNRVNREYADETLQPCWEVPNHARMVARWEKTYRAGHTPLFAVTPDLPMDPESLDESLAAITELRDRFPGWRWYLAVQDGMTAATLEEPAGLHFESMDPLQLDVFTGRPTTVLDYFDGVFLGGSDDFKLEHGPAMTAVAHAAGKPSHYGRASTPRKLAAAIAAGCDSADSAFILWTDARFIRYARAWTVLTGQLDPELETWLAAGGPITPKQEAA